MQVSSSGPLPLHGPPRKFVLLPDIGADAAAAAVVVVVVAGSGAGEGVDVTILELALEGNARQEAHPIRTRERARGGGREGGQRGLGVGHVVGVEAADRDREGERGRRTVMLRLRVYVAVWVEN